MGKTKLNKIDLNFLRTVNVKLLVDVIEILPTGPREQFEGKLLGFFSVSSPPSPIEKKIIIPP